MNEGDYKRVLKKTKELVKKVVRNVWRGAARKTSNNALVRSMMWV